MGYFRVRQFTQDDAHVFCLPGPDRIRDRRRDQPDLRDSIRPSAFEDFHDRAFHQAAQGHIGSDEIWDVATDALEARPWTQQVSIDYNINEGDGAFYGPKIDFHVRDSLKRSWQLGTIQLDFSMPAAFRTDLYVDEDNTEKDPGDDPSGGARDRSSGS